jgi:hypothetical protein
MVLLDVRMAAGVDGKAKLTIHSRTVHQSGSTPGPPRQIQDRLVLMLLSSRLRALEERGFRFVPKRTESRRWHLES